MIRIEDYVKKKLIKKSKKYLNRMEDYLVQIREGPYSWSQGIKDKNKKMKDEIKDEMK